MSLMSCLLSLKLPDDTPANYQDLTRITDRRPYTENLLSRQGMSAHYRLMHNLHITSH